MLYVVANISEERTASILRLGHNPEDHKFEIFISFTSATHLVCLNSFKKYYARRKRKRNERIVRGMRERKKRGEVGNRIGEEKEYFRTFVDKLADFH